ncbi:MAG: hypothetical protein LBK76_07070 [Verrucomicrobiales bacterium]|jgi:hypothetical protein|nr:hypothetical protein [Verrucomicrobiales bacterium]
MKRLFEDDFQRLARKLAAADGYLREWRDLLRAHADGDVPMENGRRWHVPSAVTLALLDGSPSAVARARELFLLEWQDGAALGNPVHYWNSPTFKTNDRWIGAAMLAQLLILWDWLAVAGAWRDAEIDAHAETALSVLEVYVETHLKGRGHLPILHDPINQGAAMSAGLLYAGWLFGHKWRRDARAVRMYARALNLLPDHLGQFPPCGYDGDGFTYLRHIHLQCFTLGVALLEDVTGSDWYHRCFAPNNISLAWLNRRQLDFIGPSGCSWPLGRYGYMKAWNVFALSYAARRDRDARFLQVARRDNAGYDYKSPWLRMELPLALLWYPEDLNREITTVSAPVAPVSECWPDAWAAFYDRQRQTQAVTLWLRGKAPHLVLETAASPILPGGGDAWRDANAVQPGDFDWDFQGWMLPAGRLLVHGDLPGCGVAAVDTAPQYPPKAEVTEARRTVVWHDGLLIVSDRFASRRAAAPYWQTRVLKGSRVDGADGRAATLATVSGPAARLVAADGEMSLSASGLQRLEHGTHGNLVTDFLRLTGAAGRAAFDVAVTWGADADGELQITRARDDLLTVTRRGQTRVVLLPSPSAAGLRRIGDYVTDAAVAVLAGAGGLSLFGARMLRDADSGHERLWSDVPLNISVSADELAVEGLGYGNFLSWRADGVTLSARRGNGLELYARTPRPLTLRLRGNALNAVLNDAPAALAADGDWQSLTVPAWQPPADDVIAALRAAAADGDADVIVPLLNRIRAAMLREAAPLAQELLRWDRSRIHQPDNPLATEAAQVRLEAARTLAVLGDRAAADELLALVEREQQTVYDPRAKWAAQFWGSSPRVAAAEALIFLHATPLAALAARLAPLEAVPHVQDIFARARRILADRADG